MLNNFTINNKLNALLIIYTLSAVFFQPLTITLHIAMMIYILINREWRNFIYATILLGILGGILIYINQYGFKANDWTMTSILTFTTLANLIWFVAMIKLIKFHKNIDNTETKEFLQTGESNVEL